MYGNYFRISSLVVNSISFDWLLLAFNILFEYVGLACILMHFVIFACLSKQNPLGRIMNTGIIYGQK